jgi:hypothetical protein
MKLIGFGERKDRTGRRGYDSPQAMWQLAQPDGIARYAFGYISAILWFVATIPKSP